jgi:phosphatidate cytidylyltransferase
MAQRIIWGLLYGIVLIGVVWAGTIWFTIAIGFFATLGILEYAELLKKQNMRPQTESMIILTLSLLVLIHFNSHSDMFKQIHFILSNEKLLNLFLFITFIVMLLQELLRGNPEQGLLNASANLFGTVYIGFMFAYILMVRFIPGGDGLFYILYTFLVTWFNDTAAYFTGTVFGKHKLSPRISPQKSIEGAIGGLAGGLIGSFVMALIFHKPVVLLLILGALVVVAGQIGDLIESIMKRNAGVKDSGFFLPGHGGLLDRFDSLLLAAPVVYFIVTYIAPRLKV